MNKSLHLLWNWKLGTHRPDESWRPRWEPQVRSREMGQERKCGSVVILRTTLKWHNIPVSTGQKPRDGDSQKKDKSILELILLKPWQWELILLNICLVPCIVLSSFMHIILFNHSISPMTYFFFNFCHWFLHLQHETNAVSLKYVMHMYCL